MHVDPQVLPVSYEVMIRYLKSKIDLFEHGKSHAHSHDDYFLTNGFNNNIVISRPSTIFNLNL